MQKTRQASYARQQAMAIAQGRPPPPPPVMPSLAGFRLPGQAPSPADSWSSAQAQTPAPAAPPLPPPLNTSAQPPPTSTVPTPTHPAPSPSDSSTKSSTTSGPLRARKTSSKKEKKDLSVNTNVPSPVDGEAETPTGSSGGKKRKRKNANPSQPVCSKHASMWQFSLFYFCYRKPPLHPLRPQLFLLLPLNLLPNQPSEHATASNTAPSTFLCRRLPAGNLPWSPLLLRNTPFDKVLALSMISRWSTWRPY